MSRPLREHVLIKETTTPPTPDRNAWRFTSTAAKIEAAEQRVRDARERAAAAAMAQPAPTPPPPPAPPTPTARHTLAELADTRPAPTTGDTDWRVGMWRNDDWSDA